MNWFEKIDEYLNGELSPDAKLLFQAEMAKDEELSSAVNIYQEIEAEMSKSKKHEEDEIALRKTLEGLNVRYFKNENQKELLPEENQSPDISKSKETLFIEQAKIDAPDKDKGNVKRMNLWRVGIAAAILGVVTLSVTLYLRNNNYPRISVNKKITDSSKKENDKDTSISNKNLPPNNIAQEGEEQNETNKEKIVEINPAALYADNFKPDAVPADKEGPLETAFNNIENKKYSDAIAAIDNPDRDITTRGEESDQKLLIFYASYYKAICYMAIKNIQKAIPELKSAIAKSPDHLFQIKAQWYLSLAYIKTGDLKKAGELLSQITSNKQSSSYKIKAQKLIDDLSQLK